MSFALSCRRISRATTCSQALRPRSESRRAAASIVSAVNSAMVSPATRTDKAAGLSRAPRQVRQTDWLR